MPRTLLDKNSSSNRYRDLTVLISGTVKLDKKSADDVGRVIGTKAQTAKKYLNNPEKLSVEQLIKLGRNLGIPIEHLRASLRY